MNKNETEIMSSLFHSYYEKAEGLYVNELSKREIGYIPFNGTMIRHQKVDPGNAGNGMRIFAMKTFSFIHQSFQNRYFSSITLHPIIMQIST